MGSGKGRTRRAQAKKGFVSQEVDLNVLRRKVAAFSKANKLVLDKTLPDELLAEFREVVKPGMRLTISGYRQGDSSEDLVGVVDHVSGIGMIYARWVKGEGPLAVGISAYDQMKIVANVPIELKPDVSPLSF